jgi:multidrug efflux pump subunit AcrA (membrane-fusion protein)
VPVGYGNRAAKGIFERMPLHLPPSVNVDSGELRSSLEQVVERLAELARGRVEPASFFSEVLELARKAGGVRRAVLWRPSRDASWEVVDANPRHQPSERPESGRHRDLLGEVATSGRPRVETLTAEPVNSQTSRTNLAELRIFVPIRQCDQTVGILETSHDIVRPEELPVGATTFLATLGEITADFLTQLELRKLRHSDIEWQKWDQYYQQLWQTSVNLDAVCSVISNDGRMLATADRVSVLVRRGQIYRLVSVTGVERIDSRSAAAQSLEAVATFGAFKAQSAWFQDVSNDNPQRPSNDTVKRYVQDCGAKSVGVVPIDDVAERKVRTPPLAVIVFDRFQSADELQAWQTRVELFAKRSAPALQMAMEQSSIAWWAPRQRRHPTPPRMNWRLPASGFIAATVVALCLIPMPFTISGTGELWPAHRRDVFASTSGIVDQILVAHGDDVTAGQSLLVLRDPDLENDAPRIAGEIAVANERLRGIQTARFSEGSGTDVLLRARQLTADEEELKERLKTLERQNSLVQERTAALTLRSPLAGKVLTWDVSQHLSARPVERGQSLLTVGETAGSWIAEVRVADRDVGHLIRARQHSNVELPVEFMLASEPGRVYRGQVREISLSSELDETAHSHVRVVVGLDEKQLGNPRLGATVLTKIYCGRKPMVYVWLRDLIDVIRTQILF